MKRRSVQVAAELIQNYCFWHLRPARVQDHDTEELLLQARVEDRLQSKPRVLKHSVRKLGRGEVLVFGSSLSGVHNKGAARTAKRYGAERGVSEGPTGQCYAVPTKTKKRRPLALWKINNAVRQLIAYMWSTPHKRFLISQIGCGPGAYKPEEIAPLFTDAFELPNVWLPEMFYEICADVLANKLYRLRARQPAVVALRKLHRVNRKRRKIRDIALLREYHVEGRREEKAKQRRMLHADIAAAVLKNLEPYKGCTILAFSGHGFLTKEIMTQLVDLAERNGSVLFDGLSSDKRSFGSYDRVVFAQQTTEAADIVMATREPFITTDGKTRPVRIGARIVAIMRQAELTRPVDNVPFEIWVREHRGVVTKVFGHDLCVVSVIVLTRS